MLNLLTALATCTIIYSPGHNGDAAEKYWHEMAHCNGWQHPPGRRADGHAYQPPARFKVPYRGPLVVRKMSTEAATRACRALGLDTFACAVKE